MKRRGFVLGAAGLLVPSAANAGCGIGIRRALCNSAATLPYVVDIATGSIGSGTTNTFSWPKGAPEGGDVLVATTQFNGSTNVAIAPNTGWTFLYNPGQVAGNGYLPCALAWKLAVPGIDTSSMTWSFASSANMSVCVTRIRGGAQAPPMWIQTTATASPITLGPIAGAAPNSLAILGVGGNNTISAFAAVTGYKAQGSTIGANGYAQAAYSSLPGTATGPSVSSAVTTTGNRLNGFMVIVGPG